MPINNITTKISTILDKNADVNSRRIFNTAINDLLGRLKVNL